MQTPGFTLALYRDLAVSLPDLAIGTSSLFAPLHVHVTVRGPGITRSSLSLTIIGLGECSDFPPFDSVTCVTSLRAITRLAKTSVLYPS